MANYLEVEGLLKTRLEANVAGATIYTAPDITSIVESNDRLPGVYIVYAGDQVTTAQRYAKVREAIDQRWIIATKVRNVSSSQSGASAREAAGTVLDAIFITMRNYAPSASYEQFRRISDLTPLYDGTGTYVFQSQYLLRIA